MNNKPVDLTKPIRTREGRKLKILSTQGNGDYPVIAQYDDGISDDLLRYKLNGSYYLDDYWSTYDMINIPEEPKLRPWKVDEVPLDAWFRLKDSNDSMFWKLLAVGPNGIITASVEHNLTRPILRNSFDFYLIYCEYSPDGGKNMASLRYP